MSSARKHILAIALALVIFLAGAVIGVLLDRAWLRHHGPHSVGALDRAHTELLESFHVFFLIPDAQRAAVEKCGEIWKALLHERALVLEDVEDTAVVCALCVGIQEGALRDREAIEKQLEERMGRTGEARDRVVRVVLPFAEALAKGPIAPPVTMYRAPAKPELKG